MLRFRFSAGLLLLVLGAVWAAKPASAQQRPRLPSQQHPSIQALQTVEEQTLSPVDTDALRAEDEQQSDEITPYRYGTTVDVDLTPGRHGTWERLPSGARLWRLRIQSDGAVSLSLAFSRFGLPEDASLFVSNPEGTVAHGPYTRDDATGGQHWTPLVRGEEIVIELTVPASQRRSVDLAIGKVVHGYRSIQPSQEEDATAKAGGCNLDVACEEADPWRKQIRSVGRYTFEDGNDTFVCTGSLVNNTADSTTPYFLTAEHCIPSPETAQTMTFYWNYQNETCRSPGSPANGDRTDAPLDQTSTGAIMRARYGSIHEDGRIEGKSDLTLVEIDDGIPPRYQLYLNGWSRRSAATDSSVTIHHPQGHGKRISFDRDPSTVTGYLEETSGDTHLRIGNWEMGTTEGGSSGSPLYDTDQRVVGVLSGGAAGCDNDGDVDDNDEPDWYGRIAPGFENGDYQGHTLADWLDPANSGAASIDGAELAADSIPPARPSDFAVDTVTPDSVTLTWTAPGNDGMDGTADQYLLKYRLDEPIRSKSDFEEATTVSDVPTPKPARTPQSATVPVKQDSSYYFAIVAQDAVTASPLASTAQDATPVRELRVVDPPAPNPTRKRTTLRFVVKDPQQVRVDLYDALGRRLRTLYDQQQVPSFRRQTLSADLSDLASGIYFLRIRGESNARTEQIAVVK